MGVEVDFEDEPAPEPLTYSEKKKVNCFTTPQADKYLKAPFRVLKQRRGKFS